MPWLIERIKIFIIRNYHEVPGTLNFRGCIHACSSFCPAERREKKSFSKSEEGHRWRDRAKSRQACSVTVVKAEGLVNLNSQQPP